MCTLESCLKSNGLNLPRTYLKRERFAVISWPFPQSMVSLLESLRQVFLSLCSTIYLPSIYLCRTSALLVSPCCLWISDLEAAVVIQDYATRFSEWARNIGINSAKSTNVCYTLKRNTHPTVYVEEAPIPQQSSKALVDHNVTHYPVALSRNKGAQRVVGLLRPGLKEKVLRW